MDAIHQPSEVREIVITQFQRLGQGAAQLESMDETVLIRDGRYQGRSYRSGGLLAMWLISAKLIQFYGADGAMLQTVQLGHEAAPTTQRAAA